MIILAAHHPVPSGFLWRWRLPWQILLAVVALSPMPLMIYWGIPSNSTMGYVFAFCWPYFCLLASVMLVLADDGKQGLKLALARTLLGVALCYLSVLIALAAGVAFNLNAGSWSFNTIFCLFGGVLPMVLPGRLIPSRD